MKFYGKIVIVAALVALSGCQSASNKNASATALATDPDLDRCGASDYQHYVGKPLTSIESLRFNGPVRAIPYSSVVTMDFNLNRINFMGDQQGTISRVYCG